MCIIIVKPAGKSVPEDTLRICNDRNKDGIGICWSQDGKLRTWKNVDNKAIDEAVAIAAEIEPYDALLHFRIATHGAVTVENVHPFFADDAETIAVAHNGVLDIRKAEYPDMALYFKDGWMDDPTTVREIMRLAPTYSLGKESGESDTRLFVKHIIGAFDHATEWWKVKEVKLEIERLLRSDRMAMLSLVGGLVIFNQSNFTVDDGIYYSNQTFRSYSAPKNYFGVALSSGRHADVDAEVDEYWHKNYSANRPVTAPSQPEAEHVRVTPMQVNPFTPLDKDDFLVAYYFYPEGTTNDAVVCNRCHPSFPKETDACGLFASDLSYEYLANMTCSKCNKHLTTIAETILAEIALVAEARDNAMNEHDPCVVCGEAAPNCHCTDSEIAQAKRQRGIVGSLHSTGQVSVSYMAKMLEAQGVDDGNIVGALIVKLRQLGENPDIITLREAAERYPDLFAEHVG